MTLSKVCLICEEGTLTFFVGINNVFGNPLPCCYKECSSCGSEVAGREELKLNKLIRRMNREEGSI